MVWTEAFDVWFQGVDVAARADITEKVWILRLEGPSLGRPAVDTVKGSSFSNLKELRVQSLGRPYRVLFVFDPERNVVLLISGNKAGKKRFYETLISKAEKIYRDYLEELYSGKD